MAARDRATAAAIARHARARARWPGVTCPISDEGGRYYYDHLAARKALTFFATELTLPHDGSPFRLMDWMRLLIVEPLIGWKRTADGRRRFRKVYLEIAKKNAKSALASGLGLYFLHADGEPAAQVYAVASDKEQARIVFREAAAMNQRSEALKERSEVWGGNKTDTIVVHGETSDSFFRVLSSEVRGKHGPNIHALFFDEFHEQRTRDLYETLSRGIVARPQPVIFLSTTAGSDSESICREEHDAAERAISAPMDAPEILPVIFAAAVKDDWTSAEAMAKANPSLGVTVQRDALETMVREALSEPRKQNTYKNLHLNIWTAQDEAWIPVEWWDACPATASLAGAEGLMACFGIDLAAKIDLAGFAAILRRPREGAALPLVVKSEDEAGIVREKTLNLDFNLDIFTRFWMPEARFDERRKTENTPWAQWREGGFVTVTPGTMNDFDAIYEDVTKRALPEFKAAGVTLGSFAFDSWNANQFGGALVRDGVKAVEVPQTVKMLSEPSKVFEALVRSGFVRHDGNPVMRWCVGNVAAKEDRKGGILPHKPSKNRQIDGVVAVVNALGRLLVEPEAAAPLAPMVIDF